MRRQRVVRGNGGGSGALRVEPSVRASWGHSDTGEPGSGPAGRQCSGEEPAVGAEGLGLSQGLGCSWGLVLTVSPALS